MKQQNVTPSLSYGYTAGASYSELVRCRTSNA